MCVMDGWTTHIIWGNLYTYRWTGLLLLRPSTWQVLWGGGSGTRGWLATRGWGGSLAMMGGVIGHGWSHPSWWGRGHSWRLSRRHLLGILKNLRKCFLQHDQGKQLSGTGIIKNKNAFLFISSLGGKTGRAHHGILVLHE